MTNLDSIFKSRDITLPIKVHLVKAVVFPVVMYGMGEDCLSFFRDPFQLLPEETRGAMASSSLPFKDL